MTLFGNRVFVDYQVKMRSLGWGLTRYDCVLREEKFGHRDRHAHKESVVWRRRQEWRWCIYKSGNAKGCQQATGSWEKGMEPIPPALPPQQPRRNQLDFSLLASRTRGQWISLFKPLDLWHFVVAAPANEYTEHVGKLEGKNPVPIILQMSRWQSEKTWPIAQVQRCRIASLASSRGPSI